MTRGTHPGRSGVVIDRNFEPAVEQVASRAHTAEVELRGASTPTGPANSVTGLPTVASPLYWTGTARVQALSVPSEVEGAGDEISSRRYLVQLPRAVQAGAGMVIAVLDSTDASLTGRRLVVRSATRGSLRAQRDLVCTLQSQEPTLVAIP